MEYIKRILFVIFVIFLLVVFFHFFIFILLAAFIFYIGYKIYLKVTKKNIRSKKQDKNIKINNVIMDAEYKEK